MTDADRYDALDDLIYRYGKMKAELESSLRLNPLNEDYATEIDRLADRIGELEKERDGAPLDAVLEEQSAEDRRDRAWFYQGRV